MSWDDLSKNDMRWPSVREVNAYRRQVSSSFLVCAAHLFDRNGAADTAAASGQERAHQLARAPSAGGGQLGLG